MIRQRSCANNAVSAADVSQGFVALTVNSNPPHPDRGLQSLAAILPGQHWNAARKEQCSGENASIISH